MTLLGGFATTGYRGNRTTNLPRSHHAKSAVLKNTPPTGPGPYPPDTDVWLQGLGPLFPVMHQRATISCFACHTDIQAGDLSWWTSSDLHVRKILCYHCGGSIEIHKGRIRPEDLHEYPSIGSAYSNTLQPPPTPPKKTSFRP